MLPDRRRPPHHPLLDQGNRSNIVVVTVCVRHRRPLLNRPEIVSLLIDIWRGAPHWRVGRYVCMPDHLHFFCAPARIDHFPLNRWMAFWKAKATRAWPHPKEKPIWLRDFWDRQIRSGNDYAEKWAYVRANPVRAGLVSEPDAWPYQGELSRFMWHD